MTPEPRDTGANPTTGGVEYRVVEYAPGKWTPVVAHRGLYEFQGGRWYGSAEEADEAAPDEVESLKKSWQRRRREWSERSAVVAGVYYYIGPGESAMRGFGGRTFHLRSLETGQVIECSDLWSGGVVPDFTRHDFPDTHQFVTAEDRSVQ